MTADLANLIPAYVHQPTVTLAAHSTGMAGARALREAKEVSHFGTVTDLKQSGHRLGFCILGTHS